MRMLDISLGGPEEERFVVDEEGGGSPRLGVGQPAHHGAEDVPAVALLGSVWRELHPLDVAVGIIVVLTQSTQSIAGHLVVVFSTLIGRGLTRLGSHWLRAS